MARDGSKTGGGSRKGVPNRSTARAREAIAAFVDDNSPLLQELLAEIREENGALAAFNCIRDLIEYHVPKLARQELTGKDGGAIEVKNTVEDEEIIRRAAEKYAKKLGEKQ